MITLVDLALAFAILAVERALGVRGWLGIDCRLKACEALAVRARRRPEVALLMQLQRVIPIIAAIALGACAAGNGVSRTDWPITTLRGEPGSVRVSSDGIVDRA